MYVGLVLMFDIIVVSEYMCDYIGHVNRVNECVWKWEKEREREKKKVERKKERYKMG